MFTENHKPILSLNEELACLPKPQRMCTYSKDTCGRDLSQKGIACVSAGRAAFMLGKQILLMLGEV
ncbi:hypothetical protein TIFTF001_049817 [Ficus carica]|uniref:Uncharacterized protein n=1 Tax=Ficus carica TaxID=3494 RepID=A0AA88DBJ6_FICCA|nr:hypothetical protein TIFTF001_049814 [Ficus carica]GMN32904.1 hypothetical protein TIFTF001_049817 [Ficus carica]